MTRQLADLVPGEPEVQGLLALMLLTDARRPARIGAAGQLVPLDAQDRSLWNRDKVAEGTRAAGEQRSPAARPGRIRSRRRLRRCTMKPRAWNHRLGADPRALRSPGDRGRQPHGASEPRHCDRDGGRRRGGARGARSLSTDPSAGAVASARGRPRASPGTCGTEPRSG